MIRTAVPSDASRLAEIQVFARRAAYRSIFQDDAVMFLETQVLPMALRYRDQKDALRDVYVYDDGLVKGMMCWDRTKEKEGEWELKELYIDPFFQRQGIGKLLMEEFLTHARASGIKRAALWVLEDNRFARDFYERAGFAPNGRQMLRPRTDSVLLNYEKNLEPAEKL